MADFFKGLAGGFQSGLQLSQAMRDRQQREELAQAFAKPESYTDYTPAQQQQIQGLQASGAYDVQAVPGAEGAAPTLRYVPKQGLDLQGDMPAAGIEIAPQQVQRYGGQTVAGQFDPNQLRGLQMREAARILGASGDPARAAQLLQQADDLDYNAKMRPLQEQATRLQIEAGQVGLGKTKREEATAVANQAATQEMAELRTQGPITQETISALAKKHGADPTQLLNAELAQYNFTTASLDAESKTLGKQLSRAALGGIPGMNKFLADKFDPDKTDNITPEIVQTKAGFVVMYGGKQLGEYGSHKNLNELVANVHGMISGDPLGTAKTLAQIRASNAAAAAHEADAGLAGLKGEKLKAETGYYTTRGQLDKMGATQYFTGDDNNLYANTPVFSQSGGLTYNTVKVNPDNVKFQKPGTEGKDMKPGKVAEEGEKATISGQLRISDGLGNWVPAGPNGKPLGVLPSERSKFLEKAGLPANLVPQVPWNTNGTEVMFGGKAYDVKNPADIKELKADYKRLGANTIAVEEGQKVNPHQSARGIVYDPYGASQRPRMGATQAEVDAFNARQAMEARSRAIAQQQTNLYNQQLSGLE
jgi:hypothetical protein